MILISKNLSLQRIILKTVSLALSMDKVKYTYYSTLNCMCKLVFIGIIFTLKNCIIISILIEDFISLWSFTIKSNKFFVLFFPLFP